MGDRGQVLIEDSGVYLYTHWGASNLGSLVKSAISEGKRWNDPEYLARIIFDYMKQGRDARKGDYTGYGIRTERNGDIWRLIKVNCEEGIYKDCDVNGFGENQSLEVKEESTFEEIAEEVDSE